MRDLVLGHSSAAEDTLMSLGKRFLTFSRTVVPVTLQNVWKYLSSDINQIPGDFLLQDRLK
jgi:hypothetical protein